MLQALLHPDVISSLALAVFESRALLDGILKGEGIRSVLRAWRRMISSSQQSVVLCSGVHFGSLWKPCFLSLTSANGVLWNSQDRLHHRPHLVPHRPHGCHDHSVPLQVRPRAQKGTGWWFTGCTGYECCRKMPNITVNLHWIGEGSSSIFQCHCVLVGDLWPLCQSCSPNPVI